MADSPLYWFARLESALSLGCLKLAAEAQQHLRSLGVEVRFRKNALRIIGAPPRKRTRTQQAQMKAGQR